MQFVIRGRGVRGSRPGSYPFVVLQTDGWNDYGFNTLFHATLHLSPTEEVDLGGVKVLQAGQASGRTPIPDTFDELDESYASLGQSRSYYEALDTLSPGVRDEYLVALKDSATDAGIRERFEAEPGFRNSLLRDRSLEEVSEWLSGEGGSPPPSNPERADDGASADEDAEPAPDDRPRESNQLSESERQLRDAVSVVTATTSVELKARAINQVRGILTEWADYNDERRMFAALIDVGLAELEGFVRGDTSLQSPNSIIDSLRLNVEQAIDWANANRYLKFASHLRWLVPWLVPGIW